VKRTEQEVIIIGGGIIGASSAYYLNQSGWQVTLIDQKQFGEGASYGNCGLILPGHILPLNLPGTFTKALKWMFDPAAPLYVKPRLDFHLFAWFIKFLARCNETHMLQAAKARSAVLTGAVQLFDELIQSENIKCDWAKDGVYYVFASHEEFEAYRKLDTIISQFGAKGQELNQKELHLEEPTLKKNLAGAWYYKEAAHLRPDALMKEFKRVLQDRGVIIKENVKIGSFTREKNRIRSANSSTESFKADEFVLATGAWSPEFNRNLNCQIPIQPGKGYSVTMDLHKPVLKIPCLLEEVGVVATPWSSGFRLGGTMEFSGYNTTINPKRIAALSKGAKKYLELSELKPATETRYDWRPMTYTGLPIIDRIPGFENIMLAAGHNMVGLSMGPGTGKLVSEVLNKTKPHLDIKPYQYFQ
jgi:D-amino-acid dehydrogenase